MQLHWIDWAIIFSFFLTATIIGVVVSKKAGRSKTDFFLGGRGMPWWLLGFSMVATTFSTDTPNLVTDIVRKHGVSGNWVWWAFLLSGMLTVFVYARLWRRSGVLTDVEFYEIRYSGKSAAFLRGFRAIYLGVFFNIMVMASVSLAAIKIGGIVLGLPPWQCLFWASLVTVVFSSMGGFKGVIITDFILFIMAMTGAFVAAFAAVGHPAVGGLSGLVEKFNSSPELMAKLSLFPPLDFSTTESTNLVVSVLVIPLAVQWWSAYYPGAEPGGGGYMVQRMLAAKNEKHALGATLFFNIAHYALRPWPWIIVALCSILVYPSLDSIRAAFPHADPSIIGDDTAYPAMLTLLKPGWMGLVLASLIAAYMSTISTQLNVGSSYIVNDFYLRFIKPEATQKRLVLVGRISTVLLMVAAGLLALTLKNALQMFGILLQVGAGTGLVFIMRWFWWRINAMSELVAMTVSFLIAAFFHLAHTFAWNLRLETWQELVIGVAITTVCWVVTALTTKPTDERVLREFCALIAPSGFGWRVVYDRAEKESAPIPLSSEKGNLPLCLLCMVLGCTAVYSALFATGYWIYEKTMPATICSAIAFVVSIVLISLWNKVVK